jgi:hypothetical protein
VIIDRFHAPDIIWKSIGETQKRVTRISPIKVLRVAEEVFQFGVSTSGIQPGLRMRTSDYSANKEMPCAV